MAKNEKEIEFEPTKRQRKGLEASKVGNDRMDNTHSASVGGDDNVIPREPTRIPNFRELSKEDRRRYKQLHEKSVKKMQEDIGESEDERLAVLSRRHKRRFIVIATSVGAIILAIILTVVLLLTLPDNTGFTDNNPYAEFRLTHLGKDYKIVYRLTNPDEIRPTENKDKDSDEDKKKNPNENKDLEPLVSSFISWINLGIYNDSVLHEYNKDTGNILGGHKKTWKKDASDNWSGDTLFTLNEAKDKGMEKYRYSASVAKNSKQEEVADRYNLSLNPNSAGSNTYRWQFSMCVGEAKLDKSKAEGYCIGKAYDDNSKAEIDKLFGAIDKDMELVEGRKKLTPISLKSVKIVGRKKSKWKEYKFTNDHKFLKDPKDKDGKTEKSKYEDSRFSLITY